MHVSSEAAEAVTTSTLRAPPTTMAQVTVTTLRPGAGDEEIGGFLGLSSGAWVGTIAALLVAIVAVYFGRKQWQEAKMGTEHQQAQPFQDMRLQLYTDLIPSALRAITRLQSVPVESQDRAPILEQLQAIARFGRLLGGQEESLTRDLLQEWDSRMHYIASVGYGKDGVSLDAWEGAGSLQAADTDFVEKLLEAKRYIEKQYMEQSIRSPAKRRRHVG